MASSVSRSISTGATRHVHYQSQISNASLSLSQTFSAAELSSLNESHSSLLQNSNPLVTIIYSTMSSTKDNQQILLNSYASCRRLLDHLKPVIGIQQDETIDLIDNEGKLKELNTHYDDYASQYLTARNTYYVLKVGINELGDKVYSAYINLDQLDQKLHATLTSSLNALNKSTNKPKVRYPAAGKLNPTAQSTSNTTQGKKTRTTSRK